MKKILILVLMSTLVTLMGCDGGDNGNTKFSYWKGDLPSDFYMYVDSESFYYKYSGHPYMILEYKTINNQPVSFVFGFSADLESTVVYVSEDPFDFVIPPVGPPILDDGTWGYEDKFDFTETPVQLFSGSVSTNEDFTVGLWEFWYEVDEDCILRFSFDNVSMMGHFVNSSPDWGEYGSLNTNSIHLLYQKTDSGWS